MKGQGAEELINLNVCVTYLIYPFNSERWFSSCDWQLWSQPRKTGHAGKICSQSGLPLLMVGLWSSCWRTSFPLWKWRVITMLASTRAVRLRWRNIRKCLFSNEVHGFQSGTVVKKKSLPAIAGDARDAGVIPGSGRSPGVGNGRGFPTLPIGNSWNFPFQENLACRIPRTEEPGGLQPMGSQRVGHDWAHTQLISDSYHYYYY